MQQEPKRTITGRTPSEPNMQFIKPPLSPEQRAMVDAIKAGLRRAREGR